MRARSDVLVALILWAGLSLPAAAQQALFVSDLTVRAPVSGFGGLSGIEIDPSGRNVVLLSDRGTLFHGQLLRDDTGRVDRLNVMTAEPLVDARGRTPDRGARDSEGLAQMADGRLFLSFEGQHRVAAYDGAGHSTPLPGYSGFDRLPVNGSLEGLAVDARGWLYTFAEDGDGPTPVFR